MLIGWNLEALKILEYKGGNKPVLLTCQQDRLATLPECARGCGQRMSTCHLSVTSCLSPWQHLLIFHTN